MGIVLIGTKSMNHYSEEPICFEFKYQTGSRQSHMLEFCLRSGQKFAFSYQHLYSWSLNNTNLVLDFGTCRVEITGENLTRISSGFSSHSIISVKEISDQNNLPMGMNNEPIVTSIEQINKKEEFLFE